MYSAYNISHYTYIYLIRWPDEKSVLCMLLVILYLLTSTLVSLINNQIYFYIISLKMSEIELDSSFHQVSNIFVIYISLTVYIHTYIHTHTHIIVLYLKRSLLHIITYTLLLYLLLSYVFSHFLYINLLLMYFMIN